MRLWIVFLHHVGLVTVTFKIFASTGTCTCTLLLLSLLDLSYSLVISPPPPRIVSDHNRHRNHNRHHNRHRLTTVCTASNSDSIDEETRLRFQGVGRLYEQTSLEPASTTSSTSTSTYTDILHKLQQSTVAIIGIGGVGSWAAESICRSGVGNIILLDLDDVCISNTNRQLHTTTNTIGQMKTDVMKKRLLDINPKCNVTIIHDFITEDNVFDIMTHQLLQKHNVNVIIDAIDGHTEKAALIATACIYNIPIITCGGAAGRIDPTQITCQDLSESVECKLLFWTKKKLRNQYKLFPNNHEKKKKMKKWRIPAVFSLEQVNEKNDMNNMNNIHSSSFRKCDGVLGTASFVTGTYGMIAASQAVKMIANDSYPKPRLIKSSVKYWKELHYHSTVTNNNNDHLIL